VIARKPRSKIIRQFGKAVRELRVKQGLSQEALGARAKLHRTYIGMIERGEKNITLENIEKVSDALGMPISRFFQ
jgi:transcriptional regulator with XRE-family HTH domain